MRKSVASTMQTTNEIIRKALANAQDPAPHETAAKQIEALRRTWEAQHHTGNLNAGALQAAITELKNAPAISANQNTNVASYLNDYVAKKDRRASALLEHAGPKGRAQ
jgi:hypothetical protein